jgi:GNAT superfamily N-acetyltransferase
MCGEAKSETASQVLSSEALVVLGSVRGLGVGKTLLEKTLQVVKDDGFPLLPSGLQ